MKKLLLIAAILAIGSTAFAVTEGISFNGLGTPDTMYTPVTIKSNALGNGFGDITTNDNAVHNDKAVNIFRDKGRGWEDKAATHILLNVLEPIKIESEIDFLYTQAVVGDGLNIGDIGFRVKGMGPAEIKFKFYGGLFNLPGKVTIKGHNGFYPMQTRTLTPGIESASRMVTLYGGMKEIEVDAYFNDVGSAGLKFGVIVARAEYK
ncbi:hypothetical protein NRK67_16085 [Fusobacteria bacterium ZRK30]|nr:hypothetical protein NRK67_16085 [Fusobacteria bacterium ZRK30]